MRAPYETAGLKGKQLTHSLKCTAIQDFFSKEENLNVLHDQDQQYLRSSVIGKPDISVDSAHSWAILENALHIQRRLQQNVDFRRSGANMNSTATPNTDAFLKRVIERGKGIKQNNQS